MRFLSPSLLILSAFVLGGIIFKSYAPTKCVRIENGDNIFVLTGDGRRIPLAIKKMDNASDTKVYIIGAGGPAAAASDRIIIETKSKSTHQNAIAIQQITSEGGIKKIVLVTSVDHYNRAHHLISLLSPDLLILPCPVPLTGTPAPRRLERWATEYIKYIGTLIGIKES